MEALPLEILSEIVSRLSIESFGNLCRTCVYMRCIKTFLANFVFSKLSAVCKKHLTFCEDLKKDPRLMHTNFPYSMVEIDRICKYRYGKISTPAEVDCLDCIYLTPIPKGKVRFIPNSFHGVLWATFDGDCEIEIGEKDKILFDGKVKKGERIYFDTRRYEYPLGPLSECFVKNKSCNVFMTVKYLRYKRLEDDGGDIFWLDLWRKSDRLNQ